MAEIRRYDDIMMQAIANMIALQDQITDFNKGSNIHTILDTVCRIAEREYVAIRQGYNENLSLVPYSVFKFKRKQGNKANGTSVFSRSAPVPTQSMIPIGTKWSFGGKSYLTTETGFIEAGQKNSNAIKTIAAEKGASFNLSAGVMGTIDTAVPSDVETVTNNIAITGGTDIESDVEFEDRFKMYLNGLSGTNDYAIRHAVIDLDMVRSVSLKIHKPPLKNIFNLSIYVDDGTGTLSEETLAAVKLAVMGDGTFQHQGHLAPGVEIRILPPQIILVDMSVIVEVYRADIQEAEYEVKRIIAEYINSLTIKKRVILSEISARIQNLPYVKDVKIISPAENVITGDDQIPRYGNAYVEIRETDNG
jgi:uncharacterized phage protein gp47/JayE